MSLPAPHHAGDTLFWLALAVFVAGTLAFSLLSGRVRLLYFGAFDRSRSPGVYWAVCTLQLVAAVFIAFVFIAGLGHA